jgi:two-component system, NarL family, nitrate/nitrite response regulator NarL
MIRLITIEDDPRYRTSLEVLFRYAPDFELVGVFASSVPALAHIEHVARGDDAGLDLVLLDLDLPDIGGVECTRRIKAMVPDVTVVVLTVFDERATVLEAICAGADGYLLKQSAADRLLTELRGVLDGSAPLSGGVARLLLEFVRRGAPATSQSGDRLRLTEREQDVLRCLVQGMSYSHTARELDVTIHTVRTHVRGIYGKLRVHSVAAAVSRALRDNIV